MHEYRYGTACTAASGLAKTCLALPRLDYKSTLTLYVSRTYSIRFDMTLCMYDHERNCDIIDNV